MDGMGGPGIFMPLFGLPFVAIGFFMLGGRFVGDVLARRSTFYALTDRRVMIVTGWQSQTVILGAAEKDRQRRDDHPPEWHGHAQCSLAART